ncbi:GNAT family N-acetyltransferase [Streptomyces sp. TR06-5]|uniref:GNAT family N-acetyltransferase n=1 Tax=unclassified Streptomyces TaxID=2593676 RepID=UPI00399FBFB6
MAWTLGEDLETFREAAGALLAHRPDRHTVLLSVTHQLASLGTDLYGTEPPVFGWWREPGGRVTGACLRTPPHPVTLSVMPGEAAAALPAALADGSRAANGPGHRGGPGASPPDVHGPARVVEAYTSAVAARTGSRMVQRRRERLYRLHTLRPPRPAPPGRARPATTEDRPLLVEWSAAFRREIGHGTAGSSRALDARIAEGRMMLWEDGAGPVAMAGSSPVVAGTVRIGPVYTPAEHRGRGYAAAATAAETRVRLDADVDEVLLFADLANATSNGLYRRLGYVPVDDYLAAALPG